MRNKNNYSKKYATSSEIGTEKKVYLILLVRTNIKKILYKKISFEY
jgi:hypothetical protein